MSFLPNSPVLAPETTTILLVDDDPGILETLVDIFQEMGYGTATATTGRQAIQRMQERFYNLALLDIRLPDMEGTELLAHARRLRPDMKCIMATGNASKDNAVAALNMGAHAYLEKPIDIQQVVATLNGALSDQRREFLNRELVRTLTESFLSKTPVRPDVQIASRFEFASQIAQVGGDYFDFIEYDAHRLGIVIGDVCGKGVPAAIYTGKAKDMLYAYALIDSTPEWVMTQLNRALYSQMSEECMFITMIYGILDTQKGTFTYTNAAHPPAVLYEGQSRRIVELGQTGGMVGALQDMEFSQSEIQLEPGSVLALFTDGVTEARVQQDMFGQEGVREVVSELADQDAATISNAIYDRAREFARGELRDDVAIVVVKNG